MPRDDLIALLVKARAVLDRYMFNADDEIRDDVAEVCMAIDDVLPDSGRAQLRTADTDPAALARSAA
jgi:hypothetical protein